MKFIIEDIINLDELESIESTRFNIGRECEIDLAYLIVGRRVMFFYPNGDYVKTSKVQKIDENDKYIDIYTLNRIYRLKKIK
ncbi:MAG: hypothetical protein ACRC41_14640 [Sarcina sp.]